MRRALQLIVVCTLVLGAAEALPAESKSFERAKRFAETHGLPTRLVQAGPDGDRVARLFVPYKPEHWADLLKTFNVEQGSLVFKFNEASPEGQPDNHLALVGKNPTEVYLWARRIDYPQIEHDGYGNGSRTGQVIVVDLSPEEAAHAKSWLAKRADGSDAYFRNGTGAKCMEFIPNIEVAPAPNGASTLRTVGFDEVAAKDPIPTGTTLFEVLGLRRSKNGRVLKSSLLHAANDRVQVVLFPVGDEKQTRATVRQWAVVSGRRVLQTVPAAASGDSFEAFKNLSDLQLLGPEPPQGISGVRKHGFASGVSVPVDEPEPAADRAGPRFLTEAQAAALAGHRIYVGTAASMPRALLDAVRKGALAKQERTEAFFMSTFAPKATFDPEVSAKFHSNLLFVSAGNREAAERGDATRIRDDLFRLSERIRAGEFGFDTVLVRVSPPDRDGNVSFGPSGDLTMHAIEQVLARGGKVIAEVNPNVPFTSGHNNMPYSKLSAVVESQEPLPELMQAAPMLPEETIAKNVARLIPNRSRSTLQVGIGAALAAVGGAVANKKLRIWSEMGSDWVLPLMATEKSAAREATFSFLNGSLLLYQFVDRNPEVKLEASGTVNDPAIIAKQKRMVAVNTALEVDLSGNVNAEEIDGKVVSAPGGQPNFMEGASRAKDGKAILALRSLNKFGQSTIVPALHGPTTTPGNFIDYVVTEWGATRRMRGMNDSERTYQLLSVAHPFLRPELGQTALLAGRIDAAQYAKLVRSVVPAIRLAPDRVRIRLADAALRAGLLRQTQRDEIVRSVSPGIVQDSLVNIVPPEAPGRVQ